MFCTEVAVLPAGRGHGRHQAFLARGEKKKSSVKRRFDVCRKKKKNLGSRIETLSNDLPATAAGNFK